MYQQPLFNLHGISKSTFSGRQMRKPSPKTKIKSLRSTLYLQRLTASESACTLIFNKPPPPPHFTNDKYFKIKKDSRHLPMLRVRVPFRTMAPDAGFLLSYLLLLLPLFYPYLCSRQRLLYTWEGR